MKISDELRKKIENFFPNDTELKNQLLSGNPNVISKIGIISQEGINPSDIITAYENNDMKSIYLKAKKLLELQKLYKDLNEEYYNSCEIQK